MREEKAFQQRAAAKARDANHRRTLMTAISSFEAAVQQTRATQFIDWQVARRQAAAVKKYALQHLPELLESFERQATARGTRVLWAENAAQARHCIREIVQQRQAKRVVKSKSMVTEEIELNAFLAAQGIEVFESDLGELIVQLAGEKPYHIITPAMHKTKEEIAALFHEKLNTPLTDSPEVLTMAARAHLREVYTTADIGISGANFLLADRGAIVMTENEGNGRLTMSCPPVHIAICGIEKVLPRLADLALFLPLLATSATGQHISCYNSIVCGPGQAGESDGPEEMIVILLDNGRSGIYTDPEFQESLRCIRCGACLNSCPVFRTIGGHAYNTAYQGPIGSVLTPHLRGMRTWQHLAFASSLCGACSDVCPVHIDLHHLLLRNRQRAVQAGLPGKSWAQALKIWVWLMASRARVRRFGKVRGLLRKLVAFLPAGRRTVVPTPSQKTFAELWEEHEQSR